MKISVVISAFNEEKMIEECLKSASLVADEIILVDNNSQDETAIIARKFTDKIFRRPNDPVMLNRNKNFGFSKAAGDWILSLDADERITRELATEIRKSLESSSPVVPGESKSYRSFKQVKTSLTGYEIPRKNIIFGKWIKHSLWWPDYNLRLFRNGKGKFPEKHVHEKLEVTGEIGRLENPILHLNYQTVSQYIKKLDNTYTESEAQNFIKSAKNIYWFDAIRWPVNDFIKTFFLQKGYKDGLHGLVLSQLQAFYALIFFIKVWERKENFKDLTPDNFFVSFLKEMSKASKDIKYWIYQVLIEEKPHKKIYYRIRRKIS